jgi:hypothetical protein
VDRLTQSAIFLEFIGIELDHTPKREIVSHDFFFKCANLKKYSGLEVFISRVQIELYNLVFRLENISKISLTVN